MKYVGKKLKPGDKIQLKTVWCDFCGDEVLGIKIVHTEDGDICRLCYDTNNIELEETTNE